MEIFKVVEQMPVLKSCASVSDNATRKQCHKDAVDTFLAANLKYPPLARENGIEGSAVVRFTVEKDGRLTDILLLRSLGAGTDAEVMRLISSMPEWEPGRQRGRPVRVQYNMAVPFKLTKE